MVAPVTATITTTIAAFGPMLFMTGIFGKFIYSIPYDIFDSLLNSEALFAAVSITVGRFSYSYFSHI